MLLENWRELKLLRERQPETTVDRTSDKARAWIPPPPCGPSSHVKVWRKSLIRNLIQLFALVLRCPTRWWTCDRRWRVIVFLSNSDELRPRRLHFQFSTLNQYMSVSLYDTLTWNIVTWQRDKLTFAQMDFSSSPGQVSLLAVLLVISLFFSRSAKSRFVSCEDGYRMSHQPSFSLYSLVFFFFYNQVLIILLPCKNKTSKNVVQVITAFVQTICVACII